MSERSSLRDWIELNFERANRYSRGALGIVRVTVNRFTEVRASQAAASLAYFSFFSLFPLSLLLLTVASYMVTSDSILIIIAQIVREVFPTEQDTIIDTVRAIKLIELRGLTGLAGLVGAFWASSGLFNVLIHNVNLAWPRAFVRTAFKRRLVALSMVATLILLLLLSFLTSTVSSLLSSLSLPMRMELSVVFTGLWFALLRILPWVFTFLLFLALYRWVPNTRVKWHAALRGALFPTLAWELAKILFTYYLRSGFLNFDLYGSLSTLVVFMLWIYISGVITLFGAHLTATIDQSTAR